MRAHRNPGTVGIVVLDRFKNGGGTDVEVLLYDDAPGDAS